MTQAASRISSWQVEVWVQHGCTEDASAGSTSCSEGSSALTSLPLVPEFSFNQPAFTYYRFSDGLFRWASIFKQHILANVLIFIMHLKFIFNIDKGYIVYIMQFNTYNTIYTTYKTIKIQ